jgi:hypothetical protein
MRITQADSILNFKARNLTFAGSETYIHILQYHINNARFELLTRSGTVCCCLLTCQCLILYVCSAQNNTRRMASEEERLARLRRTLHSLATRVPKVILTRVDCTFPVLKSDAVNLMHLITK